ncbi:MAG: hypothetical protein H0U16_11415, partial [Actinobacteria bacterium]|nr:hypothetical protein [Actinomycetota bacterium]
MKRILALLATLAVLLGACGGDTSSPSADEDPKKTLLSALESVESSEGFDLTLSIQSTPESIQALASDGDTELSDEDVQNILSSSISIAGRNTTDPQETATEMVLNVGGNEAFEFRAIRKDLFARADVRGLLELNDQDPAMLDALEQQATAAGADFVGPALDGEWIHLSGFQKFAESITGGTVTEPSAEDKRVIERFTESLKENAQVTSEGNDDVGAHLVTRVPLRDTYTSYVDLIGQSAAGTLDATFPPADQIPDEDIAVDVWVSGDTVTQVEFDLLQISEITGDDVPPGVD